MTPRHGRRLGVLVGIALLVPIVAPLAGASADPISDKQAEAVRIQNQIDAQGEKVSIADEQYNRAQLHVQDVEDSLAKAQADLKRSDDRMVAIKGQLAQAAVIAYMDGGSSTILSRLARSADHNDLIERSQYIQVAANDQRAILGQLKAAKEDFSTLKVKLTDEEKQAKAAADAADATRKDAIAAENAQKAILSQVQGDLADLVAAEAARRLAAEAAKAPAPIAAAAAGSAVPVAFEDVPALPKSAVSPTAGSVTPASSSAAVAAAPPPVSSGAALAVQTAEAQLGKPYVYGGAGPDSFDCSGLTMYSWRAAGVSLSHDAYQQYFETTRISLDSVQPGDLLFFGPAGVDSISHVAMYVGGGQMIEAPQTGIPVRYRGWRASDLVGAGRPG